MVLSSWLTQTMFQKGHIQAQLTLTIFIRLVHLSDRKKNLDRPSKHGNRFSQKLMKLNFLAYCFIGNFTPFSPNCPMWFDNFDPEMDSLDQYRILRLT